jgi:hypothetical protein
MRRKISIFALTLISVGLFAVQGLSTQKRVIKVQGHPHEYLTDKYGGKEDAMIRTAVSPQEGDTTYIVQDSIKCWINEPQLILDERIDTAYLIIKWTDGKAIDSVLVWGYRWNPYQIYYDSDGNRDSSFVQQHGIDMLRTVVNNDKRLSVLLQYSGVSGFAVGGIGMNLSNDGTSCSRVSLDFDIAGAQQEGFVDFVYFGDTACTVAKGQVDKPLNANNDVNAALYDYTRLGVLVHPFGAEFGYPAYDFDYWEYDGYTPNFHHWQAGWIKNGFWGYFRADNRRVPIPSADFNNDPDASQLGITYEPLQNQQVHGFVFEPNIGGFIYEVHQFDGTKRYMDCICAPCPQYITPNNKISKKK